jgi:zinc protease
VTSLHVEPGAATPLVWFTAALRGGAALDPDGLEGLTRHAAELARRGAGGLGRAALDAAIDELGANLEVELDRDAVRLSGMALGRNLDRLLELAAAVLGAPAMAEAEHAQLLRETRHELDSLRDDDGTLAERFFNRWTAPGHAYSRTVLGTESSLARIDLAAARAQRARLWHRGRLVVGFAGAIDQARAQAAAARLGDAIGDGGEATLPPAGEITMPRGRRIIVVDKPARTQCQMLIGHTAPRYGTDDYVALMPIETGFGGMFTSRLMQEVRVKRGWSYGAGCRLYRARVGHWFRMHLAPTAEVAADALALVFELYATLRKDGLTDAELEFAKGYLTGSLALGRQTARARMRQRVQHDLLGLPPGYALALDAKVAAVDRATAQRAVERWLTPDDLCAIVVATADQLVPRLEAAGLKVSEVVPADAY